MGYSNWMAENPDTVNSAVNSMNSQPMQAMGATSAVQPGAVAQGASLGAAQGQTAQQQATTQPDTFQKTANLTQGIMGAAGQGAGGIDYKSNRASMNSTQVQSDAPDGNYIKPKAGGPEMIMKIIGAVFSYGGTLASEGGDLKSQPNWTEKKAAV